MKTFVVKTSVQKLRCKNIGMSSCYFCNLDYQEEEDSFKECAECGKVMCWECMGDTCGYCSDPAGWKKYYCKEHEESKCADCGQIVCGYCNSEWVHCEWCDNTYHEYCLNVSIGVHERYCLIGAYRPVIQKIFVLPEIQQLIFEYLNNDLDNDILKEAREKRMRDQWMRCYEKKSVNRFYFSH